MWDNEVVKKERASGADQSNPEAHDQREGSPMADTTTLPAKPAKDKTIRTDRGRALYAEHADEIYCVLYPESWVWLVPSQHDATSCYEVRLGRNSSCECLDFGFQGHEGDCKHIVAATIARAKTRREIVEVQDFHESLNFFEGDPVCAGCALAHGVL
jgi:hypothetical protein